MPQLRNLTTGQIIAADVRYAESLWDRLVGFIPKHTVRPDEGLWFRDCRVIHTLGMRSKIDLIFLDRDGRVVQTRSHVRQNRPAVLCLRASSVVELGAGALDGRDLLAGDQLALR